jgi:hypothetical protein
LIIFIYYLELRLFYLSYIYHKQKLGKENVAETAINTLMDKANNKTIFLASKDTVYCCRNALITTHKCMAIICSGCRKEECDDVETISQRKGTSASNYKEQSIYNDTACYTGGNHGHDYKQFQPA